jgi:HPt (histidine-containing phosphotransfer) domain-containing protein
MKNNSLIDWQKIQSYGRINANTPGIFPELVKTYVAFAEETLAEMKKAQHNGPTLVRLGEKLRNMSESLGAKKMEALCRQIEEAGKSQKTDPVANLLAEAEATFAATEKSLRQIIMDDDRF